MEKICPQKKPLDGDGKESPLRISSNKPRIKMRPALLLLMLSMTLLSSGCLLDRFLVMREQACDIEKYVSIEAGNSIELALKEPVLIEKDLYLIMDAKPTSRLETTNGVLVNYVFEPLHASNKEQLNPADHEIELSFLFVPIGDTFRLAEISTGELPFVFNEENLVSMEDLTALSSQVCGIAINPFKRSYELELDPQMLATLPDRQMAIDWFGAPANSWQNGNQLVYEYRLKGVTDGGPVARITASFDAQDNRLVIVETSFTRYRANLDVQSAEMQVGFQL